MTKTKTKTESKPETLRLFVVKDAKGEVMPGYYDDKFKAKQARPVGGTVSPGPDHRKYRG